jgi:hypothetical protein
MMANKQAFQFWYEKESRSGGWGAPPRSPCAPCKRLPESPSGSSRVQASGVVATLRLKWEQVPERGNDIEPSNSQSSQSRNMLDKSKKSGVPASSSLLDDHKSGNSTPIKCYDSKGTAKRIFTNELLLVHAKTTKLSPAPKGASGRSCYGHAPRIAQVITFKHPCSSSYK